MVAIRASNGRGRRTETPKWVASKKTQSAWASLCHMWSSASFFQLHYDLSFHSPHSGCSADDGDKSCLPHVSFILFFDFVCLCLTTHTRPFPYPLTLYIDGTFSSSKSQSTSVVNLLLSALHRDPLWSPSRSSLPITIPLPESEWTIGFATYDKSLLLLIGSHTRIWVSWGQEPFLTC